MPEAELKDVSPSELKAFLEEAPLYSWRSFRRPPDELTHLWVDAIDGDCERCQRERPFPSILSRGGGAGLPAPRLHSRTATFKFQCAGCRREEREYHVEIVLDAIHLKIQKYGQLPRGRVARDRAVQKFLAEDLSNYEKATVCLQHEYGVAAFAYFRRIIENNIQALLELLRDDATASGGDQATLNALAELQHNSPMTDRISVANLALPTHLKPDGLNPLGALYGVLSDGIHSMPEGECLQKASLARECLTFLVAELATRRENRARFKSSVGQLSS